MITWELILALAVYNFIMYATPGPNNSILTASGIKFGFSRSIPNIFGIPTGHGLQLALVCFGLGSLFIKSIPQVDRPPLPCSVPACS